MEPRVFGPLAAAHEGAVAAQDWGTRGGGAADSEGGPTRSGAGFFSSVLRGVSRGVGALQWAFCVFFWGFRWFSGGFSGF